MAIGTTFDGFCCGWLAFAVMGLSLYRPLGAEASARRRPGLKKQKGHHPDLGDGPLLNLCVFMVRLHHPLVVGTLMPTLLRSRTRSRPDAVMCDKTALG